MPRVHFVKKARKANKAYDIKKGDSYYYWTFRRGGKRISKTHPRASQLTQSEFTGSILAAQEEVEDAMSKVEAAISNGTAKPEDFGAISDSLRDLNSQLDEQRDSCDEKKSNIEERFPSGNPTTELLDERVSFCEEHGPNAEDLAVEIESLVEDIPHMLLPANWELGEGRERPDLTNKVLIAMDLTVGGKGNGSDVICGPSPKLKKGVFYLCLLGKYNIDLPVMPPPAPKVRRKKNDPPPKPPAIEFTPDRKIMEEAWEKVKESVESFLEDLSNLP